MRLSEPVTLVISTSSVATSWRVPPISTRSSSILLWVLFWIAEPSRSRSNESWSSAVVDDVSAAGPCPRQGSLPDGCHTVG